MIRLTDEEIQKVTGWDYLSGDELILIKQATEAHLKKIVEYGDGICFHTDEDEPSRYRRDCIECWQVLLEEVK